jgi:transcriptional regulator with XRE-family HTH domain
LRDKIEGFRQRWNRAVAAVISATRNDADLTQEDVAQGLGVHRNTVSRIETGDREMTVADLALFARLTRTTPAALTDLMVRWSNTLK